MLDTIYITDEEMAALPDGIPGFLAFETLCRKRLQDILNSYGPNDNDIDVRISYISNVIAASEHYEVPGLKELEFNPGYNFDYDAARYMAREIDRVVSRMRFASLRNQRPEIVIEEPKRQKIAHLIEALRKRVEESTDLSERQQRQLLRRIDELSRMFASGSKPSLQATMVVIASIFTAINQAEAAVIKLPDVVNAVLELFGHAEEEAHERLLEQKQQKLIEDHRADRSDPPETSPSDDIPF